VDHRSGRPVRADSRATTCASGEPEARHDDPDDQKELNDGDANEDQTTAHGPWLRRRAHAESPSVVHERDG
jgi:hypothetical protein